MRISIAIFFAAFFCYVWLSCASDDPRVTTRAYPVDDGQIVVTEYQFPGPVRAYWWVSAQDAVVLANGHLFLSSSYASSGTWISLTEDIPELQANNSRVPNMGIVTNIRFRKPLNNSAQDVLLVETLTDTTYILSLEPLMLISTVQLETSPPVVSAHPFQTTIGGAIGGAPSSVLSAVLFQDVQFHPTDTSVAFGLLRDPSCRQFHSFACHSFLYMTSAAFSDFPFQTWRLVTTDFSVMQAFFGTAVSTLVDRNAAFILTKPTDEGLLLDGKMYTFSISAIESSPKAVVPFVPIMSSTFGEQTLGKFMVVAAADSKTKKIGLYMTDSNFVSGFTKADFGTHVFPSDLHPYEEDLDEQETGYTLLDVTDEVFVNVYRGSFANQQRWGHTYSSGQSGRRFTLSLPYNRRLDRAGAAVDFHRVAGIEGVIIANVVSNPDDENCRNCVDAQTCDQLCSFGTVLSRDNGKSWQRILIPSDGAAECEEAGCQLNLHSYSSAYVFNSHPIVSSKSAPGLIIATGNEGDFLDLRDDDVADASVYISRDAGESWSRLTQGRALYGETDYGGVMYMLASGRTSKTINISLDEGASWLTAPIGDSEYVFSVMLASSANPGAHYTNVLAFQGTGARNDVALFIDFSQLKERTCVNMDSPGDSDSDFELFQPRGYFDEQQGNQCFMGGIISYARKKVGAKCWVDVPADETGAPVPNFLMPRNVQLCNCTKDDYECDVNFVPDGDNCVPIVFGTPADVSSTQQNGTVDIAVTEHPAESLCESGQRVAVTTGYRKLSGDMCVGGLDLNPKTIPCPQANDGHIAGIFSLALLLACGVLLAVYQKSRNDAEFADKAAKVCFPLRCLFKTNRAAEDAPHQYTVIERDDIDDGDDPDDGDEERPLTSSADAQQLPPRRRQVVSSAVEIGEELANAANAFSVPVTVTSPEGPAESHREIDLESFAELASTEPPPLLPTADAAAPKKGNLDFLDFGQ